MRKRTHSALMTFLVLGLVGCGARSVPPAANINVPFTSQAPAGDWSEPWQNACEETSVYMVSAFYADEPIKRDQAVARIKEILAVKNERFRVSKDESLATIAALIEALGLPWHATIAYDPTVEAIKAELAAGRPVIAPVYAPALGNPFYGSPSPDYHVLVVTGYDDASGTFIVNDPGTRRGAGLRFPYATFMAAVHDLDPKDVRNGKKAVLFTSQDDWKGWLAGFGIQG